MVQVPKFLLKISAFHHQKKGKKRWNRTFYVLNIRSVDHEIKSQTYWSCHHSFDCLGKKTSRTLAIIIQLPGVSIHPKHVGFFHGNPAPGKEWRISGSLSNGDGVLILDSASSNSTCKAWPIGKVTVGCCQCRLVTNPLETGRSWGSEPTPWPFAKCNHGIQEACLNRSLRLNGVGYHSLDGQTPHVPVRDARHHHARKHTLTYLAWWLMYIIQVSSPNTPSTSDLHSNVALAKLSGSTCVFDVHLVTQAQTVYKLLHHLRLKRRDFYSTVRFMMQQRYASRSYMSCHTTFDAA